MMRYDLDLVSSAIAYKLLAATVVPRPIAWVVSQNLDGQVNAAPFSFFNVMGSAPPTIVIGILADPNRGLKDTARNILDTKEFVVNLVPERLVAQMNLTSVDAPSGMNELELAELKTEKSVHVAPPRIKASPVSFECVTHSTVTTGPDQIIVVGRVLAVHIADDFILDAEKAYIDTPALDLIARSYGAGYIRTRDTFELVRPNWKDFQKGTSAESAQ